MAWVPVAAAAALPPLPYAGEAPELRWYGRVDEVNGALTGRWRRRRDGEHELSVLPDGLVVRWRHTAAGAVDDHQRDAAGRAWATVWWEAGAPVKVTVPGAGPAGETRVEVTGWSWVDLPGGGAVWAPSGAIVTTEAVEGPLLGGTWSATLHPATSPFAAPFAVGLLEGCGCELFDRGAVWVDDHPAARHALVVRHDDARSSLVEVWAVPRGDALLVLTWRRDGDDPIAATREARTLPALVDFDHTEGGAP